MLAVDWGERRVGLAVSDPTGLLATGLPTLKVNGREEAVRGVTRVAIDQEAERVVVGLPLLLSGEKGEAAMRAEAFAAALRRSLEIPVDTCDERLTTALSARRLHETGMRGARARAKLDQGAAVALLETYLEKLRHGAGGEHEPT
ncbi:MAG TPA: Holliday junction resolvase RuvX [Candidatus Sulfotelmatobacter sp.]|nr:Holliday junction resolvase RuvX [Candidatus Sulfotelmatobacter sp.]